MVGEYHRLKIEREFFLQKMLRRKMFEIRKNDRDFRLGDRVVYEVDGELKVDFPMQITYITDYEQKDGYVVFGEEFVYHKLHSLLNLVLAGA